MFFCELMNVVKKNYHDFLMVFCFFFLLLNFVVFNYFMICDMTQSHSISLLGMADIKLFMA